MLSEESSKGFFSIFLSKAEKFTSGSHRMVAEAATGKSKHHQMMAQARANANGKRGGKTTTLPQRT
jgi:hypothetical protein